MSPDPIEDQVTAALRAAAPDDTGVESGLQDLHARVSGRAMAGPLSVTHGARPRRPGVVLAAAAVVLLVVGTAVIAGRSGSDTDPVVTPAAPTTPTDPPQSRASELTIAPVQEVRPCAGGPTQPSEVPDVDDTSCYLLGEPVADGTDLTDAAVIDTDAAVDDAEPTTISVNARLESVAALNRLFNACFAGDEACPALTRPPGSGSVAITWNGQVISAPTINAADLADDTFIIAGPSDRSLAQELADVINGN